MDWRRPIHHPSRAGGSASHATVVLWAVRLEWFVGRVAHAHGRSGGRTLVVHHRTLVLAILIRWIRVVVVVIELH